MDLETSNVSILLTNENVEQLSIKNRADRTSLENVKQTGDVARLRKASDSCIPCHIHNGARTLPPKASENSLRALRRS